MTPPSSLQSSLRIASLNLYNFAKPPFSFYHPDEHYSALQWQEKCLWLSSQLKHVQPAIIGFQEVFSPDELARICQSCGLPFFSTVSNPVLAEDDPFLFIKPVVALASLYPIETITVLKPDIELLAAFNLPIDFQFNREPIKAKILTPVLGAATFYIVHLKSKRPTSLSSYTDVAFKEQPIASALLNTTLGRYHSDMQRSLELALIYQDVIKSQTEGEHCTLVMGDFNDQITSDGLGFIFNQVISDGLAQTPSFGVTDSYQGSEQHRAGTHYYQNQGKVLDYILLSTPLLLPQSPFYVEFNAIDQHILNTSGLEQKLSSDHAFIYIDITKK
ncbi:endonuclease/exonuclease/phosphatase family protein [Pseudoalteromonas tunicata]|uniref:endonuclease/exonuclease/phosphatase family protein n=1 Tax=Pseudoalteromonas tunicata TaxID=314281 RepID=UPI00273F7960|nr:endonuclease/exonuclease/phosphatase family protein [Pseudoalteromonas tunicata]MDP5211996.1 endonuclease/exonuclease/phosphatase family protein [Pseudoalteromonas tunicata]